LGLIYQKTNKEKGDQNFEYSKNITLISLASYVQGWLIQHKKGTGRTRFMFKRFDIQKADLFAFHLANLSGGNQHKKCTYQNDGHSTEHFYSDEAHSRV